MTSWSTNKKPFTEIVGVLLFREKREYFLALNEHLTTDERCGRVFSSSCCLLYVLSFARFLCHTTPRAETRTQRGAVPSNLKLLENALTLLSLIRRYRWTDGWNKYNTAMMKLDRNDDGLSTSHQGALCCHLSLFHQRT
jgi:hypothetical protein